MAVASESDPIQPNGGKWHFHAGKHIACCIKRTDIVHDCDLLTDAGVWKVPYFIVSITVFWKDSSGKVQSKKNYAKDILQRANRTGEKMYGSWNFQVGKYNGDGAPHEPIRDGVVFTWWNWPGSAVEDCSAQEGCAH